MDEEVRRLDVSVDDTIVVHHLQPITDLDENVPDFSLAQPASLGLDVALQVLLAVLEEEIEVLGGLGWLVELNDVGTFQFHQDLNLAPYHFLILDVFEGDGLDGKQLALIVLDVAAVDCSKAAFSQFDGGDHISLHYLTSHHKSKLYIKNGGLNHARHARPAAAVSDRRSRNR